MKKVATIRCKKTGAEEVPLNAKNVTIFSSCYYKNSSWYCEDKRFFEITYVSIPKFYIIRIYTYCIQCISP